MITWGWQDDAACRGEDLMLFFGPEGETRSQKTSREREAQAVCRGCPARIPCLEYALSRPERDGWWSIGEDERAKERRRRMRRAAAQREGVA